MSETTKPKVGGRPKVPLSASECRTRIAFETCYQQRPARLRLLYRLLKSYTDAQKAEREDRKIAAIEQQNALKAEELIRKKARYILAFTSKPLGQQAIIKQNETLKARIAELERALANSGSEAVPTLTESAGDRA